jgi:dihydrofolate reductase
MLSIISAMDKNGLIGTGQGLPWHVKEEYQRYLDTVKGKKIIVGRKTFELSGEDLKDEQVFILSTSKTGGNYYSNIEEAMKACGDNDIFVTGGAEVYKLAMPFADTLYISVIKGEYEGCIYFPEIDPNTWTIIQHEECPEYDYYIYKKLGN